MLCKRGLCCHAVSVCVCVCLCVRHVCTFCQNELTYLRNFSLSGSLTILVFHTKRHGDIPTGTPLTGALNAGAVGRNRDSEPISGFILAAKAATGQVLSTRSPVDHGHCPATSCDTWLVVSGGLDCRRRWQNVYDKTSTLCQRQQKAHLTAHSDKSVVYIG